MEITKKGYITMCDRILSECGDRLSQREAMILRRIVNQKRWARGSEIIDASMLFDRVDAWANYYERGVKS